MNGQPSSPPEAAPPCGPWALLAPPRDGAGCGAKGVSEEGLGGHCGQQGRPCLCQGNGEVIRTSLPVGSLLSLLAWSAHWVSGGQGFVCHANEFGL